MKNINFNCNDVNINDTCTYLTGDDVVTRLNFWDEPDIGACFGYMLLIGIGCLILSYISMKVSSRKL